MEFEELIDRHVLGDQIMLPRRLSVWLLGNCLRSEGVLLEKALLDQFLQVSSERPIMDGLVPFTIVVGAVLLQPRECGIVLDRLRASDPWLIFYGVK